VSKSSIREQISRAIQLVTLNQLPLALASGTGV
jgi:hypothetical protein